jgi:hypothetical protein
LEKEKTKKTKQLRRERSEFKIKNSESRLPRYYGYRKCKTKTEGESSATDLMVSSFRRRFIKPKIETRNWTLQDQGAPVSHKPHFK